MQKSTDLHNSCRHSSLAFQFLNCVLLLIYKQYMDVAQHCNVRLLLNQSVLLMDMNLQSPSLAGVFGIESDRGFQHYLKGEAEIEDLLVNPSIERLVVVPGAGSAANSSELLSAPATAQFFKDAKRRYKNRFIVCDLPALLPTDDVLAVMSNLDCVLLVIEEGKNSAVDLKRALQILQSTELIGTILNKTHSDLKMEESTLGR